MTNSTAIRKVQSADQSVLDALLRSISGPSSLPANVPRSWFKTTYERVIKEGLRDGSVLVSGGPVTPVAVGVLAPRRMRITMLYVAPAHRHRGAGKKMLAALERLAVSYGQLALEVETVDGLSGFLLDHGYRLVEWTSQQAVTGLRIPVMRLQRRFPNRQTRYGRQIARVHRQLGIPKDYGSRHALCLQNEHVRPVPVGQDMFGRDQTLAPDPAGAWLKMQTAATRHGIELQLVSAFRSVDYQAGILERKLQAGQTIEQVLAVSAAPGYSEHHSGRAIDLSTPGYRVLEEEFEDSPAFEWLTASAQTCGFRLSYPRENRHGVAYEPWHWYWTG